MDPVVRPSICFLLPPFPFPSSLPPFPPLPLYRPRIQMNKLRRELEGKSSEILKELEKELKNSKVLSLSPSL